MKLYFLHTLLSALLLCFFSQFASADSDTANSNLALPSGIEQFCAKILEVEPIEKLNKSQSAKILDRDSKFFTRVLVEKVNKSVRFNMKVGQAEYLAIHSPSRFFGGSSETILNKRYVFRVDWDDNLLPKFAGATFEKSCK